MNWKEQRVEIQETKEIIRPRSNKWTGREAHFYERKAA